MHSMQEVASSPPTTSHGSHILLKVLMRKFKGDLSYWLSYTFHPGTWPCRYAKEHQPCVIFMDEIDAIGGRRFSEGTSADREIQRTLMELLSQLDGFDVVGKVRAGLM